MFLTTYFLKRQCKIHFAPTPFSVSNAAFLFFSLFFLISFHFPIYSADFVATLDSSDGSSAFVFNDSGDNTVISLDSNGNVQIKGGMRLDASGVKCTTAEMLIVDGKIGLFAPVTAGESLSPRSGLHVVTGNGGINGNWYEPGNFAATIHQDSNSTEHYGLLVSSRWLAAENYVFCVDGRFTNGNGSIAEDNHNPYLTVRGDGCVGIFTASPGWRFHVNGTAAKPGGGSWTDSSDIRLKKNVKTLENALGKMTSLHGVSFEWTEPEHASLFPGTQMGMIAQEVETVFPQWVGESKGYKDLTFRGFEALTVESFRQIKTQFESQINRLENRIKELENYNLKGVSK